MVIRRIMGAIVMDTLLIVLLDRVVTMVVEIIEWVEEVAVGMTIAVAFR
jgi:hypothetical protein